MPRHIGETSHKETAFGVIPRSKLILLEIEGIKRAWDFILKRRTKKLITITVSFIQQVHRVGFGWIFPEQAGKFRLIDVRVSRHTPPKSYQVPSLMLDFTRDLEVRMSHLVGTDSPTFVTELVALLAWTHHRFLWIHPFFDYNGRLARLLVNVVLLNLNLPPIELKIETAATRRTYVKALEQADHGDNALLEKIIMDALKEAVVLLEVKES